MTVDAFLGRLRGVRRSGNGWTALCPGHQDRENSLSVGIGDDQRILLKCFAGCPPKAIVEALGLTLKDLFADANRSRANQRGRRKNAVG